MVAFVSSILHKFPFECSRAPLVGSFLCIPWMDTFPWTPKNIHSIVSFIKRKMLKGPTFSHGKQKERNSDLLFLWYFFN